MTIAEKMADEWEDKIVYSPFDSAQIKIVELIAMIAERGIEEACNMQNDEWEQEWIRKNRWWEKEA